MLTLLAATALAAPDTGGTPELPHPADTVERTALSVLAGWSLANVTLGVAAGLQDDDPRRRSFHLGNAAWNTVNLGIAGAGLVGLATRSPETPESRDRRHRNLQRALAINLGLDAAYIGTGVALWVVPQGGEREEELRGLGQALVVQGAFLAVFDGIFLAAHRRATERRRGLSASSSRYRRSHRLSTASMP